jgi:2-methylisocitrate lyase-like PEP mutase family enzyme
VDRTDLTVRARRLRELHEHGTLVMPNAWDAASAVMVVRAGAEAVATTSGGVAWSLGRPDGEGLTRTEMAEAVRRIVAAVEVPVTADVESGYGPAPSDVAATVRAVLAAGAVGVNIEDSRSDDGSLFTPQQQADRLRAARAAAVEAGVPELVVNVRTDVFLRQLGDPAGRLDDVLERAATYAKAGADVLFVPGLLDLDVLTRLVDASPLPVNVMAAPGGPTVADLRGIGVRRVTVGTALSQAAYTAAHRAARELLDEGRLTALGSAMGYPELNACFTARA